MKKRKNLLKQLLVNTLVFSLIQGQTMSLAYAMETKDISDAIGIVGKIGQDITNQRGALMQEQMARVQAQNIQKQLQPKMGPSKYFPECQLPNAMQAVPLNVCPATNNPAQLPMLYAYENAAQNMSNYFDQMMNEVTKVDNIGLACLSNQKKGLDSQMIGMINNLTRLQTQLKEEAERFRENNKGIISDLEETNSELNGTQDGGSSKNSLDGKTKDFSKMVNPDCQKVIGAEFGNAAGIGFNGMLKSVAPKNLAANDFQRSKSQIDTEIKAQVQKLKDSIKENGLSDWAGQDGNGNGRGQLDLAENLSSYPSIGLIMQRERLTYQKQVNRISADLKKYNYDLPIADKDISSTLASSISSVQEDLKKEYVNDCTVNSKKGVAIDINVIIGGIEQRGTENSPMAVAGYKTALKNIMDSDDSLSDKLKRVQELEKEYPKISYSYTDFKGATTTETPFTVLSKTKANCEAKFEDVAASDAKKVQKLLGEYKNTTDGFAAKMGSKIIDTIINCNGEGLKATDACNENTLNPSAPGNFCLAKATSCANNMNSCYNELTSAVTKRTTKMKNQAQRFNTNVENMVARAKVLYKAQLNNITKLTTMVQQRFPGTNFEIPTDMFVTLPATNKNKFGLDLAADGNIDKIVEELPSKVDKLKEMFAKQKDEADREIADYIRAQKTNMGLEKAKFTKMYNECKGAADQSAKVIADMDAAKQKNQSETDQKLGEFCTKYSNLGSNPAAGCGDGDASALYNDSIKITAYLDPKIGPMLNSYKGVCAQANNESERQAKIEACEEYIKADEKESCLRKARARKSGTSSNKEKIVKLDYKNLCDSNETKDKDFIKNAGKKLKLTISDEDISSITDALKEKDSSKISNSKLSFFINLIDDTSTIKDGKINFCTNLNNSLKPASAKVEAQAAVAATPAVKEVKDSAGNVTTKGQDAVLAKPAVAEVPAYTEDERNTVLSAKLTDYARSETTGQENILTDLGEQIKNTPCVANSNKTTPKGLFDFDINAYDASRTKGVSH